MKSFILRGIGVVTLVSLCFTITYSQINIFDVMQRRDLRLQQVEALAKRYFDSTGTERGTGYKQYQRWLYEQQFHVDENGYSLPPNHDWNAYIQSKYSAASPLGSELLAGESAPGAWIEKGPHNWNRTSGWNPGVGRITSIAVNPADTNIIYVTSPGGGVWKSTSGGNAWTPLTDHNGSWMNMMSVAIDPNNTNTIYAGSSANIIIKSTDGGATWNQINYGHTGSIRRILIHPSNSNLIYVTAGNGVWKSTNAGATWTRTYANVIEDLEFIGNGDVMMASGSLVLRSTDAGNTWTTMGTADGVQSSARTLITTCPSDPNRVYLLQSKGSEFGFVLMSTDKGATFTTQITGASASCTNFFGYETTGCGTGGQASYDMAITVNPNNADDIYIAGIIVWRSTNAGKNFSPMTAWSYPNSIGYNHADVHVLEWVNNSIYSGSDGGIYRSSDFADNWTDLSKGLGIRQFYRIGSSKTNAQLFTGGAQDNGSSAYKNGVWTDWLGADGMDGLVHPTNESILFGTSQYGSLYRSLNGGASYTSLPKPSSGEWVTPLDYHEGTNTLYGAWTGIYKSTDNGSTWTNVSGNNITTTLSTLAVAPTDPNVIYTSRSAVLYASRDGGATWSSYSTPASINAIAVSPMNPLKIWVVCNSTFNRVLLSTDGGATFTNISGNLPTVVGRAIAVDNNANETVYLGMNMGVYTIDNTTSTWTDISDNIPMVAINDINIQKSGNILRLATYGRGVWERPLASESVIACGVPQTVASNNVTTNSAGLTWQGVSGASSYKVEYQLAGATSWIVAAAATTTTSFQLNNLTEGSAYNFRISASCSSGTGDFANGQFTTMLNCSTPGSLVTTNITEAGAVLTWNNVSGANSYSVDYRVQGATSWLNASSNNTSNSISLSSLNSSTNYQWQVKANCASGSSIYASASFTTASPVVCYDAFEANNSSKQSKSIVMGAPSKGGIDKSVDEDWFKFSTGNTSSTNVRVSLTQLPADYDLFLYDKGLRKVASSENAGNIDEVLVYNSNTTRTTYYVRVVGKNGSFNPSACYSVMPETSTVPFAPVGTVASTRTDDQTIPAEGVVYPNPSGGKFTLRFNSTLEGAASLSIVDATGVSVQTRNVNVAKGVNQFEINGNTLKPGYYMVKVKGDKVSIVRPVIIVR